MATSFVVRFFKDSSLKAELEKKDTIQQQTLQENEYLKSLVGQTSNSFNNGNEIIELFLTTEELEKELAERKMEIENLKEEISKLSMQLTLNAKYARQEIDGESLLICLSMKCLFIFVTTS